MRIDPVVIGHAWDYA